MPMKTSDRFAAFASLNRYFTLTETSQATVQQAEEAKTFLCQMYGADNEQELLERGDSALIEAYQEFKHEIMKKALAQ